MRSQEALLPAREERSLNPESVPVPVPLVARERSEQPAPASTDWESTSAPNFTLVRGRVLFADGVPAEGVIVAIGSSGSVPRAEASDPATHPGRTGPQGEFELLEEGTPRSLELEVIGAVPRAIYTCSRTDEVALAASGATWDVGDLRLSDLLRLELRIEIEPELRDELASCGGSALQILVKTGSALRAQALFDETWSLTDFTQRDRVIWIPAHPAIEVALALRLSHSPLPNWFDRRTLVRDALQRSYGTAEFHFRAAHLIRGVVRRESGLPAQQISVHLFARGDGDQTQTALTRTNTEGRFAFVVPLELTAKIWAQNAPERSLDYFARGGQTVELFLDLSRLVRIRWRDTSGQPIERYYAGAFHLGGRRASPATHPLALFERDRGDGTAELSVKRVPVGSRWVLFSSTQGEALWTAPRDLEGGPTIHELSSEDLVLSRAWRLFDREGRAFVPRAHWRFELAELGEPAGAKPHAAIRYTFHSATMAAEVALPNVLDLRYSYTMHEGETLIASGVVDATKAHDREFALTIDPAR